MFSFTVQMSDGRVVPFLQYVVSLAVVEGIEGHCMSKVRAHPLKTARFSVVLDECIIFSYVGSERRKRIQSLIIRCSSCVARTKTCCVMGLLISIARTIC